MFRAGYIIALSLTLILKASSQVSVVIERNTGASASSQFKFNNVPAPSKNNAAASARSKLVLGQRDAASGGLSALTDGALPADEDQPAGNFFFNAGSYGGRLLFDFGAIIEITQVNTYSWHSSTRGPQLYNLFASDGSDPKFNPEPDGRTDPAACGWKLVATVDTRPKQGEPGGQYGVSIVDSNGGALGRFRYVLFDAVPTETDDPWGNTFFSEIVVSSMK
jgi:nitrogen fixation protein FixH